MNNINSMTGFAVVQDQFNDLELTCELRSLNSRYLEISVKLPRLLADMENVVKDLIRSKIDRGKILYSLNYSSITSELKNLKIDKDTVSVYLNLLEQLKSAAGIDSPIKLDHLLFFKDIISFEEKNDIDEEFWGFVEKLTLKAVVQLNEMRSMEGNNLRNDLKERLNKIKSLTDEAGKLGKDNSKKEFDKLYSRLTTIISTDKIDPVRLEQEVAIISDRVDISEEVVRMKSHIQLFEKNLKAGSPIGKKLNFILQEMHRESNTISNKTTLLDVSHRIVAVKEEIEKLREQIQNIE